MKIPEHSPFLFGKLCIWETPIFDLNKITQDLENFQNILERKLKVTLTPPYLQPPNITKTLGRLKDTIRFDDGSIDLDYIPLLFKNMNLGFGEKGYYYDIFLRNDKFNLKSLKSDVLKIVDGINVIENVIRNDLKEFYFTEDLNISQEILHEISNFDMSIQIEDQFLNEKMSLFSKFEEILKKSSEKIVKNSNNVVLPQFRFGIASELMITQPQIYNRAKKYIHNGRIFSIHLIEPKYNIWQIVARGVPIQSILDILEILF